MTENEKDYKKIGLWLSVVGALLILIEGIAVLAAGKIYTFSAAGTTATGGAEIILSIIMFIAVPFYEKSPAGVGWGIVALSVITMPFGGGFYIIGAIIALIGGAMIATKK